MLSITLVTGEDSVALIAVEWLGAMLVVAFERNKNSQIKNTMLCFSCFDIKMHYAKRKSRRVL
jgi:hypothetical protein